MLGFLFIKAEKLGRMNEFGTMKNASVEFLHKSSGQGEVNKDDKMRRSFTLVNCISLPRDDRGSSPNIGAEI